MVSENRSEFELIMMKCKSNNLICKYLIDSMGYNYSWSGDFTNEVIPQHCFHVLLCCLIEWDEQLAEEVHGAFNIQINAFHTSHVSSIVSPPLHLLNAVIQYLLSDNVLGLNDEHYLDIAMKQMNLFVNF